jgi:hypothetical protein
VQEGGYIDLVGIKKIVTEMDRWSLGPALVSLITVATLTFLCELPGMVSFLLIPISLLGYAVGSIAVVGTALFLVFKKRPRRAASVLLVLLIPLLLWAPINRIAELAHLGLTAGFGAGQLGGRQRPNGSSDFAVYDWSVGLAGGPNTFLIHDVTDEITLPMAQHTRPSSSENGWGEDCAGKVRRLMAHYYVCTI